MTPEKRAAKIFKYDEPTDARYLISNDEFSQARISTILQLTESLKSNLPVFAGLVVYGSLTKGKLLTQEALPHTDIDAILFIDRERLMAEMPRLADDPTFQKLLLDVKNNPAFNVEGLTPEEAEQFITDIAIGNYYEDLAISRFKEISTETTTPHFSVSANIIRRDNGTSMYEKVSDNADGIVHVKRRSDKDWIPDIAGLFMLDVGGNLREYRKSFFDRLSKESPERANLLWSSVYRNIKGWERIGPLAETLRNQYPETAQQAQLYYVNGGPQISTTGALVVPPKLI